MAGETFPPPDEAKAILQEARSGNLYTFTRRLGHYNVNFQADASAIDGDSEEALSTREGYAKARGIPEKWRKHILENALPAFHEGRTSLHMAAANGQSEIVRYICMSTTDQQHSRSLDINRQDKFGYTPLHLAAHSWHGVQRDKVVAELLKHPVIDPNVVATNMGDGRLQSAESWNDTALHLATFLGFTKTVEQLLEWRSATTVGNNNNNNNKKMIDIIAKNKLGFTPLHQAVNNVDMLSAVPITKALLKFIHEHEQSPDVTVNVLANKKLTALHIAVMRASYKVVDLLLRANSIDADIKDKRGFTPFDIAVRNADYKLVLMLQSHFERTGLYGDSKAYASAASTILVGASLLTSVTFAAWLHPPVSYFQTVTDSYSSESSAELHHEWDIQMFLVFNSLSFFFAIATFLAAAGAAIPSKGIRLAHVRTAVHMASFFVVLSLLFAMAAFAMAGLMLLPHPDAYKWSMIGTLALGGTTCLLPLLLFLRKLLRATCPYFFFIDFIVTGWFLHHVKDPLKNCMLKLKLVNFFVESCNSMVNPDIMRHDSPDRDWQANAIQRANRQAHRYIYSQE